VEGKEALLQVGLGGGGHFLFALEGSGGRAPPHDAQTCGGDCVEVAEEAVLAEDEMGSLL
jgi:hypothetical protein